MHKKLEAELVSLAHSILQMKNKEDVVALHKKAQDIAEKLALLKFVNSYIDDTPTVSEEKEEIINENLAAVVDEEHKVIEIIEEAFDELQESTSQKIEFDEVFAEEPIFERASEKKDEAPVEVEEVVFDKKEVGIEIDDILAQDEDLFVKKEVFSHEEIEEIFETKDPEVKDDIRDVASIQFSLEEETEPAESISEVDTTTVFEKTPNEEAVPAKPKSLNDVLFTSNLQVGLNDRIAFVKHLFDGSQEDFNRVLSQLNSFKSEQEAKSFIKSFVKPDYDWSEKEEYELRLINLIERKFL